MDKVGLQSKTGATGCCYEPNTDVYIQINIVFSKFL